MHDTHDQETSTTPASCCLPPPPDIIEYSVVMDFPPFSNTVEPSLPRDRQIEPVIRGTEVTIDDFVIPKSGCFGSFEWVLRAGEDRTRRYVSSRKTVEERLKTLYHTSVIRYAEW
jgi:hypothetical protein